MPSVYGPLFRQRLDSITRAWVDEIYAERRTDLPNLLSFRELVAFVPEICDEAARLLDEEATDGEIVAAARASRAHAQTRFHQGVRVDEVARELTLLREVVNEFLWREGLPEAEGGLGELAAALRRANRFLDELIAQAVLIYAASLRPCVPTRDAIWPPPRRRR
ncbi:MAG: RsbRD N-terminal domain-containing protein [Acidobacteriota bacterium]|nr:RsbRD N-terminal domain-containing protein [Acidobacteriota bacterium]